MVESKGKRDKTGFSRRAFFRGSGAVAAASALHVENADAAQATLRVTRGPTTITLNVNGEKRKAEIEPRTTLLEVLRYQFDLTGAKPVSRDGNSGASTVWIDGKTVTASTTLAIACRGKAIRTAESLGGENPDAVCQAFVESDAQQCGFCTPGFVVAVKAFLDKNPNASEEQIRQGLNGNICRCGTYHNIVQAAVSVVKGGGNG
jgi:xanthine dehydrogenase YagT iron-sulfur-binding subunit